MRFKHQDLIKFSIPSQPSHISGYSLKTFLLIKIWIVYYFYWTHGFSRKGLINSTLSIRSFIRNADISGSVLQKILKVGAA